MINKTSYTPVMPSCVTNFANSVISCANWLGRKVSALFGSIPGVKTISDLFQKTFFTPKQVVEPTIETPVEETEVPVEAPKPRTWVDFNTNLAIHAGFTVGTAAAVALGIVFEKPDTLLSLSSPTAKAVLGAVAVAGFATGAFLSFKQSA